MRATASELEASIEANQRALELARQRERAEKLRPLQTAVGSVQDALHRHAARVAVAEARIKELQDIVIVLAHREESQLGTLLTECYTSIACLRAMIDDAERVNDELSNALTDAQLALKNASK